MTQFHTAASRVLCNTCEALLPGADVNPWERFERWHARFTTLFYAWRGAGHRRAPCGFNGSASKVHTLEVQESMNRARIVQVTFFQSGGFGAPLHRWRDLDEEVFATSAAGGLEESIEAAIQGRAQWLECEAEDRAEALDEYRIAQLYELDGRYSSFEAFRADYLRERLAYG